MKDNLSIYDLHFYLQRHVPMLQLADVIEKDIVPTIHPYGNYVLRNVMLATMRQLHRNHLAEMPCPRRADG